ncbi:J-type co-chaperone JAC1 [Diplonema papillatum]|nr:J-type co-chaperone JAC1 [Diplonema papillatum]
MMRRYVVRVSHGVTPYSRGSRHHSQGKVDLADKVLRCNCFEVLGVEPSFDVSDVKKTHRDLQRQLHPDLAAGESAEVSDKLQEASSKCSGCFTTITDPYSRGCLLLKLRTGRDLESEQLAEELAEKLDEDFLDEFFAIKMEAMSLMEGDAAAPATVERLREIDALNTKTYESYVARLGEAFSENDMHAAEMVLLKLNYFRKLRQQLRDSLPVD